LLEQAVVSLVQQGDRAVPPGVSTPALLVTLVVIVPLRVMQVVTETEPPIIDKVVAEVVQAV
tara:strand:+ start:474 stop:659 length:186 start_codon:yes stop_codon:yes gene_type:complete